MMRALFPNIAFYLCAATVTSAAQTCVREVLDLDALKFSAHTGTFTM